MTAASVFRLTSASRTTSAAWLTIGERISVVVAVMPPARSRARFSIRESPTPVAPPRSIAVATPGEPSEAFVMPVTPIPNGSSCATRVRVLCVMASRSISRRGALIVWQKRARRGPGRR